MIAQWLYYFKKHDFFYKILIIFGSMDTFKIFIELNLEHEAYIRNSLFIVFDPFASIEIIDIVPSL